jgi:excisionase family DNA binding protein
MSTALLTARRVAETLDVSPETVLRWTRRGELPAIRLPGGAIRYRATQLEEWLAARELQTGDEPAGNGLEVTTPPRQATRNGHSG